MTKKVVTLLLAAFFAGAAYGQSVPANGIPDPGANQVTVGGVDVSNKASEFKIKYQIKFGKNVRKCNVELKVSNNGGKSFDINPKNRSLSGDVGKILNPGSKEIRYNITEDKNMLIDKDIVFEVDVTSKDVLKLRTFILGQLDVPNLSGGLMLGLCRTVGGYIRFSSNFTWMPANCLRCNSAGQILDGPVSGHLWTDGKSKKSIMSVTGGVLFRAANFLYPYVGLGYGSYNVLWHDVNDNWYRVEEYSRNSVSIDAGLIWNIKGFALSTGVSAVAFKVLNFNIGIGCSF